MYEALTLMSSHALISHGKYHKGGCDVSSSAVVSYRPICSDTINTVQSTYKHHHPLTSRSSTQYVRISEQNEKGPGHVIHV